MSIQLPQVRQASHPVPDVVDLVETPSDPGADSPTEPAATERRTAKAIRILVADDHELVRLGICALLRSFPGVEVVGEARDGHETLELVAERRPTLVLADIGMPRMNGLELARRLNKDWPSLPILILSMHSSEEYVLQALRAGAAGYLVKDSGRAELELAIQSVARGETYLCPAISRHVTDYVKRAGVSDRPVEQLPPRQREVLQLIAEGHTTKSIAKVLGISIKTVDTHRMQLMQRLDIHDVAGLVRYAIKVGIVSPED